MTEKNKRLREFEKQSHLDAPCGSAAPFSSGRRTLLIGMAASCAGFTASALAHKKPLVPSTIVAPSNQQFAEAPCWRSTVVASDKATVVETSAGKIPIR